MTTRLPADRADATITGFASLREARSGNLSFFSDRRYRQSLENTRATAVLVPIGWTAIPANVTGLAVNDPSAAFDKLVDKYGFQSAPVRYGIHGSAVVANSVFADGTRVSVGANAVIDEEAQIGADVEIGAGCYIGRGVRVGAGSKLFANATVHEGCVLGKRVVLHSGVVIGADGFGYEFCEWPPSQSASIGHRANR